MPLSNVPSVALLILLATTALTLAKTPFTDRQSATPEQAAAVDRMVADLHADLLQNKTRQIEFNCQSCQAVAVEFHQQLGLVRNPRTSKLLFDEAEDIMDKVCTGQNFRNNWGLVINEAGEVLFKLTNKANTLKASGSWVARRSEEICAEIIDNDAEEYKALFEKTCHAKPESGPKCVLSDDYRFSVCAEMKDYCGFDEVSKKYVQKAKEAQAKEKKRNKAKKKAKRKTSEL